MKIRPVYNWQKLLSVSSSFLVQKKKMAFHLLSIEELIFIAWEEHRGEERLGMPQSREHCSICRKQIDTVVDLLRLRWRADSYKPFDSFMKELLNTDKYDYMMRHTSTETMHTLEIYYRNDPFWIDQLSK